MGTSTEMLGTPFNPISSVVFSNLLASSGYGAESYPWKVTLVNSSVVNASSTPGGQLYVYGGLIQLIGQNKGLWAAVLSHETAHTGLRHGVRLCLQQEYNERMIEYYRFRMRQGDKSAGISLAAFQISSALLMKKMEREQEHQADQQGMLIMARAGYHPDFVFALHHLLSMNSGEQSKFAAFFSDHPRWETRDQRSDRLYADALAEFNRQWPDVASSPGGSPPVVAFIGKPQSSENRQEVEADLSIPLYCRNSKSPVDLLVRLFKDNKPVKTNDQRYSDQSGNFVLRQETECLDRDDAVPLSIRIPATAVSEHERSTKATLLIASSGEMIASFRSFDVHFPKLSKEQQIAKSTTVPQPPTRRDRVEAEKPTAQGSLGKMKEASITAEKSVTQPAVQTASIAQPPKSLSTISASAPSTLAAASSRPASGVLGILGGDWTDSYTHGVEILEVVPGGSAAVAGLHVHEVITDVNGRSIASTADLASALSQNGPGAKIIVGYMFKSNLGWMPSEKVLFLAEK